MMASVLAKLLHFVFFLESVFALVVHHNYSNMREKTYGGNWKYLTFLNLNVKALCFTLFFLDDVLEVIGAKLPAMASFRRVISKIKTVLFSSLALPASMLVFVLFWGLYFIDRELVYPKHFDKLFPVWANHVWHSTVLTVVLEAILVKHPYPKYKLSLLVSNFCGLSYVCWVLWVEKVGGVVIYPFLGKLHGVWFALFVAGVFGFIHLLFHFGKFLNDLTIGISNEKSAKSSNKFE